MQLTKTTTPVKEKDIERRWHLFDAQGQILGRLSSDIAQKLIGKHKAQYSPHMDSGDYIVVINAKDIEITGRKQDQKVYTRYSGYPGGLKTITFKRMMEKDPAKVILNAVSGMLPKNKLRDVRMTRLFVYADNNHPHTDKFKS